MIRKVMVFVLLLVMIVAGVNTVQGSQGKHRTTIRIMAAASLTEVYNDLKQAFEQKNQDISLEINYAGSQALYNQIKAGVPADIFASANIKYMDQLDEAGLVVDPTVFAYNKLVLAVAEKSNCIYKMADVLIPDIKLVIADEAVPVGRYTIQMLDKQADNPALPENFKEKFLANVVSKELDVKSVVAKVILGEADAGIVYKTDINTSNQKDLRVINIEDGYNVIATYPIALLKGRSEQHKTAAAKFIAFLYSTEGDRILEKHGFVCVN